MKLTFILPIAFTIWISNAHSQNDPNVYLGDAKERLDEQIDISLVCQELTARVYKISEKIKRFEHSQYHLASTLNDTVSHFNKTERINEGGIYSARKRVIILPFITAEKAEENPELWEKSIENAKETDAHYVIRGVVESAKAEPKLKEGGSQGNLRMYAGFEGSISFSIQIYDLELDEELEDSKLSDRGLLKSDVIKGTTNVLNIGSQLLGKGTLGNATKTGVNTLVDQTLPQTKTEAINEAINRSEKYLTELLRETFPMYFPYLGMDIQPKKGIEIKFINYPDSELIKGQKVDIIFINNQKEESIAVEAIEVINETNFSITVNDKQAEKLKKSIDEYGQEKLFAKIGKEKLTTKAKISKIW